MNQPLEETPDDSAGLPGALWVRAAAAGLTFRSIGAGDMVFLRTIYAATRQAELDLVDWSKAQKDAFVEMQFQAQHAHYSTHNPNMDRLMISLREEAIGRIYLDRRPKDHAIVDIAFLPEHRGRGLGSALLQDVLDEAAGARRTVSIHVEKFSPAMRLYRRLGFVTIEDMSIYDQMRWSPNDQVETQAKTAS